MKKEDRVPATPEEIAALKVGSTVWLFDSNRRVYPKDGGPAIYSEHFVPMNIESETSRSFVTKGGHKIKKSDAAGASSVRVAASGSFGTGRVFLTRAAVDDDIWDNRHRYGIIERLKYGREVTTEKLREIAEIVGYEPEAKR